MTKYDQSELHIHLAGLTLSNAPFSGDSLFHQADATAFINIYKHMRPLKCREVQSTI